MFEELSWETLQGTVTCGARQGYEGDKEYTLDDVLTTLDAVHKLRSESGRVVLPCVVQEGTLVGAVKSNSYREKVYLFNFMWSARMDPIDYNRFNSALLEYASELGTRLQQERMYVDHDNKTTILKR